MLKIIELSNLASKRVKANNNKIVESGNGEKANEIIVNLFKNNKSRESMHMQNIKATKELNFLTSNTKKIFNHL